jgi:hypothetical protein
LLARRFFDEYKSFFLTKSKKYFIIKKRSSRDGGNYEKIDQYSDNGGDAFGASGVYNSHKRGRAKAFHQQDYLHSGRGNSRQRVERQ